MLKKKISLFKAIAETSYDNNNKDSIVAMLYDKFSTNSKLYLMEFKNDINNSNCKIIVIQYNLPIQFQEKTIPVSLLFYFVPYFPLVGPEVYIEKIYEIIVNINLVNNLISANTLRVNYDTQVKWNGSTSSMDELLSWLKIKFDQNFPVYKADRATFYGEKCQLKKNSLTEISFEEDSPVYEPQAKSMYNIDPLSIEGYNHDFDNNMNHTNINNAYNNNNNNNANHYNNNNNNFNRYNTNSYIDSNNHNDGFSLMSVMSAPVPSHNINNTNINSNNNKMLIDLNSFPPSVLSNVGYQQPTESDVTNILRREIMFKVKPIVNDLAYQLYSHSEELNKISSTQKKANDMKLQSESQIGSLLTEYDNLKLKYDNLIAQNTKEVIRLKQIEDCCQLDKIEVMLNIDNKSKELLKWISKEKMLEENILVLRHKFKKTKENFIETQNLIRTLSRELFNVKYKINTLV